MEPGSQHAEIFVLTSNEQFSGTEVSKLRKQLEEIQGTLKDDQFVGPDGKPLKGQESLRSLLERCWRWTEIVLERCVLHSSGA